jgi:PhnB protein
VSSLLNPYLSFNGTARQAMEFYQDVFGGELVVRTFGEYGGQDPATADQVMHAQLETPKGYTVMASDSPPGADEAKSGNNFTISLSGEDEDLRGYWDRLTEGGSITIPLEKQMWGDEFGACVDKFGIPWMVNITAPQAA